MLTELFGQDDAAILQRWMDNQLAGSGFRPDRISRAELQENATQFLSAFRRALSSGSTDIHGADWAAVRHVLDVLSASRAERGFSPSETATFIFSLKQPLFDRIRGLHEKDGVKLADTTWEINQILDKLGLYTAEVFQRSRDAIIARQQQEVLELSTPVVALWDGILALPLIGTLDSARTQIVMETLLQRIVDSGAAIAIIDITGVPTVDTLTAQHLLKTVAAARLMGADCIISGIRPQIAQTIVHLGVELGSVVTKATLADAFRVALQRTGLAVQKQLPHERKPPAERDRTSGGSEA
ncbi:MAG: anti-anti-sigma factor [Acidobacteria bacterium]|nr:MAG: anti-anti-sigma factor [Acidobacteriota bacterium]